MTNRNRFIGLALACAASAAWAAPLCSQWSAPRKVGSLDVGVLPEASGLAISTKADRLYHIGDKGNVPAVYMTDTKGRNTGEIDIPGMSADHDMEEMAYGPCGSDSCVYIGNIGDNDVTRESIEIYWFQDQESVAKDPSFKKITLRYPDGSHNAEAFVVHPKTGDLFIFTKASEKHGPSQIFRLAAATLAKGGSATLQSIGEIDVPALLEGFKKKDLVVTGASVSKEGDRLLLLTYKNVLEIAWDFKGEPKSASEMEEGVDYNRIELALPKQEALSFLPDDAGFLVTSEAKKDGEAPIVRVDCAK